MGLQQPASGRTAPGAVASEPAASASTAAASARSGMIRAFEAKTSVSSSSAAGSKLACAGGTAADAAALGAQVKTLALLERVRGYLLRQSSAFFSSPAQQRLETELGAFLQTQDDAVRAADAARMAAARLRSGSSSALGQLPVSRLIPPAARAAVQVPSRPAAAKPAQTLRRLGTQARAALRATLLSSLRTADFADGGGGSSSASGSSAAEPSSKKRKRGDS